MNELARHIEYLLLENDCVILPDFGGFVAHYAEASYEKESQLFTPPMRTIGFNPRLRLNDGLLTQSVMEVEGTNYGDAQKMVIRWVNLLKEKLYEEGSVELANVGQLRMSIRGTMDFVPYNSRITTSWLYGLGSFEMPLLSAKSQRAVQPLQRTLVPRVKELMPHVNSVNLRPLTRVTPALMQTAAAVVAVLVLFFCFSTPVKNTEVMAGAGGSYAQLMPSELFDRIEKQSVAIHEVPLPQEEKKPVVVERTTVRNNKVKQSTSNKAPKATVATAKAPVQVAPTKPATVKAAPTKVVASSAAKPTAKPATANSASTNPSATKPSETKPAATKTAATNPTATKPAASNDFHIIVASVATEEDARHMAEQLVRKGYGEAKVIVRDGKNRVSLRSLPSQAAAYHAVNALREENQFAGAWVLHCKVK